MIFVITRFIGHHVIKRTNIKMTKHYYNNPTTGTVTTTIHHFVQQNKHNTIIATRTVPSEEKRLIQPIGYYTYFQLTTTKYSNDNKSFSMILMQNTLRTSHKAAMELPKISTLIVYCRELLIMTSSITLFVEIIYKLGRFTVASALNRYPPKSDPWAAQLSIQPRQGS